MKKRILSGLTAFMICAIMVVAPLSMPTYALTTSNDSGSGRLWNDYLNSDAETFEDYINRAGIGFREGSFGAERGGTFGTPKRFYNQGSTQKEDNNVESVLNDGTTTYTNFIYNHTSSSSSSYSYTFQYDGDTYDVTEINYNADYDLYQLVTTNYNFYIEYSPTYVTVLYTDTTEKCSYKSNIYYQLPDGRNSYNLSSSDVWGTYFIYDAINYSQVLEDDGKTRNLYHFDDDLLNSAINKFGSSSASPDVPSFAPGKFSSALVQNSVNYYRRYVSFPYSLSVGTAELWVYFSPNFYFSDGSLHSFSQVMPCWLYGQNSDSYKWYSIPTGTWVHLAWVASDNNYMYSGTTNNCRLFINGKYTAEVVYPFGSSIDNTVYIDGGGADQYYSAQFGVDEFRCMEPKNIMYTSDFTPSQQPFDTNLVLVLPETAEETNIAIKSSIPVSSLRVGGVRPTISDNGYVYVYLEDDVVKDVQQYQVDGWYSVDASIYDNGSWVDLDNYNLSSYVLDEDSFVDTDTPSPTPTPDGNGSSDSSSGDNSTDDTDNEDGILSKLVSTITNFIGNLFTTVFGGILDLVNILIDNLNGLLDSFTSITGLIGSLFGFFPDEIITVLTIGLSAIFILAIIKMFKG